MEILENYFSMLDICCIGVEKALNSTPKKLVKARKYYETLRRIPLYISQIQRTSEDPLIKEIAKIFLHNVRTIRLCMMFGWNRVVCHGTARPEVKQYWNPDQINLSRNEIAYLFRNLSESRRRRFPYMYVCRN